MRRWLVIPMILTAALFGGGVGANAAASPAQIVDCAASTWCFSPNPIRVTAGSTVTWANGTSATHTATSTTGAWSTGRIAPGATSAAITFNTPGTFAYHCAIHPTFMTGTIIVAAATPAATVAAVSPRAAARPATRLAQSGAGPLVPIAAALVLLGLALLTPAVWRRRPRER